MTRAVPSPKPPARRGFLYRELAGRIADALRDGSYAVGDRIPSVRRLARQHRVSIATAVQALRHLESQRLVLGSIKHLMAGDLAPVHAVDSIVTRTS